MPTTRLISSAIVLILLHCAGIASAQSINGNARTVAMGGRPGSDGNIAAGMAATPDQVIPIPLGLIQLFKGGFEKFNPTSDRFDPVRATELASSPMHYTFGRDESRPGEDFINDLVNGRLNPNLATYAGFRIPETFYAEGLGAPHAGGTIKFARRGTGFHGVYLGAGPYISFNTQLDVDPKLAALLGDGTSAPNASMSLTNQSQIQVALAVTVGYRGRIPLSGRLAGDGPRDGLYLAYNYNVLKGFRYLEPGVSGRFDTNAAGNLVVSPAVTPLTLLSLQGRSGKGRASDVGVQVVRGPIEAGFGLNGIGNQIDWSDFTLSRYTLSSLVTGLDFVETSLAPPVTERRVTLPVAKSANVGFRDGGWGAVAIVGHGFNGKSFHGGVERQVGPMWLRGGGKYTRGKWDPTYGFGIGRRIALDVGFYGTHANLEGRRQTAMAISLRISHESN